MTATSHHPLFHFQRSIRALQTDSRLANTCSEPYLWTRERHLTAIIASHGANDNERYMAHSLSKVCRRGGRPAYEVTHPWKREASTYTQQQQQHHHSSPNTPCVRKNTRMFDIQIRPSARRANGNEPDGAMCVRILSAQCVCNSH